MKFQLLPSSFEENGQASPRQHLACFVIDDLVAIDAGSLAMSTTSNQKKQIRDVILTHAHLDHIAGLPLYIDDLFATIRRPIQVYATEEIIKTLEKNIFNWSVYPRFSQLKNDFGKVMQYREFEAGEKFKVKHLSIKAVKVNHNVPCFGLIISDDTTKVAFTSDTARMDEFWKVINKEKKLSAILVECAFPNELDELADVSYHLTPKTLKRELAKIKNQNCPIYVVNIKPMYREQIVKQIEELDLENLRILEVGKIYEW
ncbi:MAG TPA: 3',5'-cyclic-nucleotide phosphodiesterase [Pyrinomonadaceae bacterium]|nr:3',5'-cyclic-nucleotide phosphodiesterase [Pyrinomonadaceae bacterium]